MIVTFLILGPLDKGILNFGKKNSSQGFFNTPGHKFNKDRVSKPKPQGGNGGNRSYIPICTKFGKKNEGKCLVSTDGFSKCGKSGYKMRDFHCLLLKEGMDHEGSTDVETSMLKVFHVDMYDLLDLGATLLFVTPYVAMRFDISLEILSNPFHIFTPVGDSIVTKRVYRNCHIFVSHRVTHVDLVDFDVILGMDWLHACYASIDCRTRLVAFKVPNEPIMSWEWRNYVLKGCLYHLV
ncbi:hypothetical protein MTR67_001754 [Solanum verrucosum]|uniref:Gag-pol polyprotein n=1 Tax=Solanum verrucosum TaxID=315347 RepID=A0AAF0PNT6_SOLVR|nr:hypothetical protein MTR67_001754 [Solanum verrucosum]